jgi:DNA-binding FadR family transcriptional regulator
MLVNGGPEAVAGLDPVEIGGRYGVSRSVVREALRVLEAKGLVTSRPNVGTRLRPYPEWNLFDQQVIDWRVHSPQGQEQMRELLEVRTAIEPFAARLAAARIDRDKKGTLERACSSLVAAFEAHDLDAFTRADIELHGALLTASGNAMIAQLAGVVAEALRAREELLLSPDTLAARAVHLHVELVDAVVAGDVSRAETRMRELLDEVSHDLTESPAGKGAE